MLSAPELEQRRELLGGSDELQALARRLAERVAPLLARRPAVPAVKALLSADGGICADHAEALVFDPWSPSAHRCPRCGRTHAGERHDRAWARYQHLWLAEGAATLATLAALAGHDGAAAGAAEILGAYASSYLQYPNQDNVLGPSRLFFSTYLESIWITDYLAAATLLRESDRLPDELADGVGTVAEEAANLIGEFDEGLSNRQTWHNAALAAIAVWFEDAELLDRAVQAPTGMLAHLLQGFGDDGMWYEGENYHLFALRGQLIAMGWARQAGMELLENERLAARLAAALRAPALTALPDHTFPARKDSRFGVSLAQPMYLELWEVGLARLGDAGSDLWSWLRELYASPAPVAGTFDSYLHEAGGPAPASPRTRADLSWWALLEMAPALPDDPAPWTPESVLLESQGLAILRDGGGRYASLECGRFGGGHGHPDRLHLSVFADGRLWLADPGTGPYVSPDLFWYRSTLAHDAPRLDGRSQPPGDAQCDAFDVQERWSWARGRFGGLSRTLVSGPYLLDVVELDASEEHLLELPWHPAGEVTVATPGGWTSDRLDDRFVRDVERFTGSTADGVVLRASEGGAALTLHLRFEGELLRARAPGRPNEEGERTFFLVRSRGRAVRFVAVLDTTPGTPTVRTVGLDGEVIVVDTAEGRDRHLATGEGWEIARGEGTVRLAGLRRAAGAPKKLFDLDRPTRAAATAPHVSPPPALDGSLDGFESGAPLTMDFEDQYRRSEEPYPGPEALSATALVNWDEDALYLGVEVVKPEVVVRPSDSPPLRLDNEPDEIHADGVQVYLRPAPDGPVYGFLVTLVGEHGLRVRPAGESAATPQMVSGAWSRSEGGYTLSLRIALPEWSPRGGDTLDFDVLVNEMRPGRVRRAGQLVWSGGGGWVYLRGDRQSPEAFGVLELE